MFWKKLRILALPLITEILLGGGFAYSAYVERSNTRGMLVFAAFALIYLLGAVGTTWRVAHWEPEEVEAYQKAQFGFWRMVFLAFAVICVFVFVDVYIPQIPDSVMASIAALTAVFFVVWLYLRHRKFQKEAKHKIRERKARENEEQQARVISP